METLEALVPRAPDWSIPWDKIEATPLGPLFRAMGTTLQNPRYHGEGDVWTHTRLVCTALTELDGFRRESPRGRAILFLSALLHDLGKITCTKWEDDRWTSPNHAPSGSRMARELLIRDLGLAGTAEKLEFREAVCLLIRYHSLPPYALEEEDGHRRLRRVAANGSLTREFTLERLCILSEADALGRICPGREDMVDRVRLCAELAAEAGCLRGPYPFPDAHTAHAYLSGREVAPEVPLYDDTWGPVLLMAGLPGTGKDTWLQKNYPHLPMICLDDIRRDLGMGHTGDQSPVMEEAYRRARALLRQKQPFVWNATNVLTAYRRSQITLFEEYGARVRVVYLETAWEERIRRNRGRRADQVVPEAAAERMLASLTLPEAWEAHAVDWICI